MSVDTPDHIVDNYPFTLYAAKADNNYHLLERLKTQQNVHLCYISGEYLHVVFRNDDNHIGYPDTELKEVEPTIEDCFIQLMKYESN